MPEDIVAKPIQPIGTKISDTQMQETVEQPPLIITYDYDDIIKRRAEAQEQADMYASIVKDFDILLSKMDAVGCKPTPVEEVKPEEVVDVTREP